VLAAELPTDAGAQLLKLPADAVARSDGLAALAKEAGAGEGAAARAHSTHDVARRAAAAASPEPLALSTLRYAKRLRATGAFEYVEPNRLMQTHAIVGNFPPNDRAYGYQRWHYELINVPAAMQRITALNPQPAVRPVVAVIDDGVVLDHPDLQPQLFSPGRAFISMNSQGDADRADGDNISTAADEPVFHGTHVAGTVGAATYDGIGGAGTAPMAQIMPLRVFPPRRGAASIDVIQAMRYAARLTNRSGQLPARRADVINLSLGSDSACDGAYQTAVNDARGAGVIVVAAAGNSGNNNAGRRAAVGSPANCTGVVAVSAVDAKRTITNYSNTGSQIAVAAPGGDGSVSTTGNGAPDNVYSDVATFDTAGRRQPAFGGMQGTSMASPHVAGVMALMRFVNPNLTVTQVDSLIAAGSLTDELGTPGRDIDYGFGLINARKAVDAALAALGTPPPAQNAPVVALPSELTFGAAATTAVVELSAAGTTTETVVATQVVLPAGASTGAVTLTPPAGSTNGLGRYTVSVNRNAFSGDGTFYPSINFTLNSARVVTVQLTVQKLAGGGTSTSANFGPIYVLLIDPATGNVEHTVLATLAAGRYQWSFNGYAKSRVAIVAGGDLDNDDFICARGEPCGAYPLLQPGERYQPIDLTGNRSDLNFQVAPLAGISPASVGPGATTDRGPWRRQAVQAVPAGLDGRQ
jgi:serine protease